MTGRRDADGGRAPDHRAAADGRPVRRGVDRRLMDEVFGQTLPETTSDEARGGGERLDDDWWREQRPPHHD